MKLSVDKLKSFEQTIQHIKKNINEYWTDILLYPELLELTPKQYFDFIQNYKYVADPKNIEFVTRPKYLLKEIFAGRKFFCDCDDRTGLSGIYFKAKNVLNNKNHSMKIIVSGQKEAVKEVNTLFGKVSIQYPHHVYLEVDKNAFDPTYPENKFNEKLFKEFYRKEFKV